MSTIDLKFNTLTNISNIKLIDDSSVSLYCKLWNKFKPPIQPTIYDIFNDYLKILPSDKLIQLNNLFIKTSELLNEDLIINSDHIKVILNDISEIINEYFLILDFDDFKLKFGQDKRFRYDLCEKTIIGKRDTESLTYLRKDYEDLLLFTQFLKGLFPIIGGLFNSIGSLVGDVIYVTVSNILSNTKCAEFEVYKKLYRYVITIQKIRGDSEGYSLMGGITQEDISDYLFGLLFVRRVIQYEYNTEKSIMSLLWHLLDNTCVAIKNTKPKEVSDKDKDGTERGIDDRWNISQKQPIADRIIVEHYLSGINQVLLNIDQSIDLNLVNRFQSSIDINTFNINNYHLPLCGIILQDVLDLPNLEVINRQSFLNTILISSVVMTHIGIPNLTTLMLSQPLRKNPEALVIGAKLFKNIRSDIQQRFDRIYPHLPRNENPGIIGLNKILVDINQFDWSGILDITDIGLDILTLIEKTNIEKEDVLTLIK